MTQDKILMQLCESLSAQMDFNRKLVNKISEMQTVIDLLVKHSGLSSEAIILVLNKKE